MTRVRNCWSSCCRFSNALVCSVWCLVLGDETANTKHAPGKDGLDSRQGKSMSAETETVIEIQPPSRPPPGLHPCAEPGVRRAVMVPDTLYCSGKRILDVVLALVIAV